MILSLIVARAANGVIGADGGLPWHISADLKHFKALTVGKPIIMGRRTYDSIGKPLPGRPNIVITRNPDFGPDGVVVAHSLDEGLECAEAAARQLGVNEICVIGGGIVYRESMDRATILHVTHVDAEIDGDAFFPAIDPEIWVPGPAENVPAGEKDEYPSRFVTYRRKS